MYLIRPWPNLAWCQCQADFKKALQAEPVDIFGFTTLHDACVNLAGNEDGKSSERERRQVQNPGLPLLGEAVQ